MVLFFIGRLHALYKTIGLDYFQQITYFTLYFKLRSTNNTIYTV
jgi:hypothetical protein